MAKRLGWYLPEQLILKITLLGSKPKIWRRVEVDSGLTLHDLHHVIQAVFSWEDSHLYQFFVTAGGKLTQKATSEATRYQTPRNDYVLPGDSIRPLPTDEAMIGRVFTADFKQIVYEYDFGDSWQHLVKLEKRTPGGTQDHIPVCLAGANAAPSDDLGGIGGYYMYLEALYDESHEMREDSREVFGDDFDLTKFDLDAANLSLKNAFKRVTKKKKKLGERE